MIKISTNLIDGFRDLINGRNTSELIKKAYRLFRREGLSGLKRKLADGGVSYSNWITRYDSLTGVDRALIKQHIDRLAYKPTISVLIPVYNTNERWLKRSIDSVKNQLYPYWELCIADDASTLPHIRLILEEAMKADSRIKVAFRSSNGHISAATNSAMELATGEFIALLDHDDELTEHALYHVAVALDRQPELDLIYSDEDKIDVKGRRFGHYFKPDWNPDLFLGQNLICHLGVYRTNLARSIQGFREGFEGSQDWDFASRYIDQLKPDRIYHIPHVLYHWRSIRGSTAVSIDEKTYALNASKKALEDFWRRRNVFVAVEHIAHGHFRTNFSLPEVQPTISIIIPTKNRLDLLRNCLDGIFCHTDYLKLEVLVVDNDSDDPETLSYLEDLAVNERIRLLKYPAPFNFAAINNWAVSQASGQIICLLNNDIEPISKDWLKEMVSHALRPEIGAVGAMLYYPNNKIQHAGVLLDGIAAGHLHLGYTRGTSGYANRAKLVQNLSAVTAACLVIRKTVWEEVGGMDESSFPVAFNDVDFCLRVREKGYRNLWTPFAELYHHESASRGLEDTPEKQARFRTEVACLQAKWGMQLSHDPAWNPNLGLNGTRIHLANPPRISKPWLSGIPNRISIALATCNGGRYLPMLLDSILRQDSMPFELVVSDDASEDDTLAILESFADHAPFSVNIYRNSARLGVVENFSRAILHCKGDYIALADQDDVWIKQKLARFSAAFDQPNCVAVFSDANVVSATLRKLGYTMWQRLRFSVHEQNLVIQGHAFEVLLKHKIVTGATLAFKSNLRETIFPIPSHWPHDAWIAMIASLVGRLSAIKEPLIDYRQHDGNVVGGQKKTLMEEAAIAVKLDRSGWYQNEIENLLNLKIRMKLVSVTAAAEQILEEKIAHLETRASLPMARWRRFPVVMREIAAGRYARFARNWGSAAIDLLVR